MHGNSGRCSCCVSKTSSGALHAAVIRLLRTHSQGSFWRSFRVANAFPARNHNSRPRAVSCYSRSTSTSVFCHRAPFAKESVPSVGALVSRICISAQHASRGLAPLCVPNALPIATMWRRLRHPILALRPAPRASAHLNVLHVLHPCLKLTSCDSPRHTDLCRLH